MRMDTNGVSNHLDGGVIDHEQDANHVALLDESEVNYISVYGFKTEGALDNNEETYIDSIAEEGDWERTIHSIVEDNKENYYHITVQSDNGKPLSSFNG
jgi:hypothetical protein